MFCPRCGAEYRPGFTECADCLVPLVEYLPEPEAQEPHTEVTLVTVFQSSNVSLLALAKSLLSAKGIPFIVKGEVLQDLFGWGRFPTSMNLATGPADIQVSSENEEEARTLLARLGTPDSRSAEAYDIGEDET
jgi:hypothetical protein